MTRSTQIKGKQIMKPATTASWRGATVLLAMAAVISACGGGSGTEASAEATRAKPLAVAPASATATATGTPSATATATATATPSATAASAATVTTCADDPNLDASCTQGSVGTAADDSRLLPLVPSVERSVHLVNIKPGGGQRLPDRNVRAMGSFDRPHIPPYRTTTDGRIAMQTKTRTPSVDIGDFQFYLYEPKKLKTSFLSSGTGEAAGNASMNLLASRDAFKVPTKSFVGPLAKGSVIHSAICNDPKEDAVKTCGPGGKNDCHQFSVIAPLITKSASNQDQIEFWGTKVTVEVESPKTAASKILDIRTSAPVKGATWTQGGARVLLENTITRDGRLLVARVGGLALEYPGADGRLISGRYNIVYSAIDPSLPACDPAGFKTPYPITHMPYDPLIKANYGAGRFLWTYPDGTVVPDGADTRTTYPWVSSNGENVFFASSDGQKTLQGNNPNRDPYQTKCLEIGRAHV